MPHGSPRGAAKAATPREGELGEPPPSPSPSPRPGMPPHVLRTTSSMLDVQAASFPDQTVSFRWLEHFVEGNRARLAGLKTVEVSDTLLKPETEARRCSYVQLLDRERTEDGRPAVGTATCFVSHAWGGLFLDLCESVIPWAAEHDPDGFVWLDVFAVNQHAPEQPSEWWDTTFREAVGTLGHTLLVLTPWDEPLALRRVWCLWEILCTIEQNAKLTVVMPKHQMELLAKALQDDMDEVQKRVADVDAEQARAFKDADKQRIFEAVKRLLPRGFLDLNNKVKDRLRQWTHDSGEKELQAMPEDERATSGLITALAEYQRKANEYSRAEALFTEAMEGRRRLLGDLDPETLSAIGGLGYLFEFQGKNEQAQPLLVEALEGRRQTLGNEDEKTLESMNDLGNLYLSTDKFEQAEALYKEALAGRRRVLKPTDYGMLQSLNNLGRLYRRVEEYDLAEPYFEEALEGRRTSLGNDHPATLHSMGNLGGLKQSKHDLAGAAKLFNEALSGQRKRLGDDHADTLSTMLKLGQLHVSTGDRAAAKALFEEAATGFLKISGEGHPDTRQAQALLRELESGEPEPEPETDPARLLDAAREELRAHGERMQSNAVELAALRKARAERVRPE